MLEVWEAAEILPTPSLPGAHDAPSLTAARSACPSQLKLLMHVRRLGLPRWAPPSLGRDRETGVKPSSAPNPDHYFRDLALQPQQRRQSPVRIKQCQIVLSFGGLD